MFWYGWPSWVTELGSGLLLTGAAYYLPEFLWFPACSVVSAFYERFFDPNKWSWKDIGQRTVGIILGCIILHFVKLI